MYIHIYIHEFHAIHSTHKHTHTLKSTHPPAHENGKKDTGDYINTYTHVYKTHIHAHEQILSLNHP